MNNTLLNNIKKGPTMKPLRIMIVGVEGVGKSTAGAAMPNPVFICGEDGLVGPQFAETASFTPTSWAEVLQFCDELQASPDHGYKTLVIDTLDWIEPLLYAHVVQAAKKPDIKNIEDFGYGKGYAIAQQEARNLLSRLERLNGAGMAVCILAHCAVKAFHNPAGEDYDRYEPKVNAKIAGLFREWCDCVLFAQFEQFIKQDGMKAKAVGGQNRIVNTVHSAAWDAKNRYGLPPVLPLDMAAILEAIAKGQPADTATLKAELDALIAQMPEGEKRDKSTAWLRAGKFTPQQLAMMINKVKTEISLNNQED